MLIMMVINANKWLLICSANTLMDLDIDWQWLLASEKDRQSNILYTWGLHNYPSYEILLPKHGNWIEAKF